jgi:hypothetical protein
LACFTPWSSIRKTIRPLLQRREHLAIGAQAGVGGDALDAVPLEPGEEEVGRHHARLLVEHAHRPAGAREAKRHQRRVAHVRRHDDRAAPFGERRAQVLQALELSAFDQHRLVLAAVEHRHDLEHRGGIDPAGFAQHRRHRRIARRPAERQGDLGLHAAAARPAEPVLQLAEESGRRCQHARSRCPA